VTSWRLGNVSLYTTDVAFEKKKINVIISRAFFVFMFQSSPVYGTCCCDVAAVVAVVAAIFFLSRVLVAG